MDATSIYSADVVPTTASADDIIAYNFATRGTLNTDASATSECRERSAPANLLGGY